MSKTVQEIMEVMGKTIEASFALTRKNGSSYYHIADITSEDINEVRYYFDGALYCSVMRCLELKLKGNWTATAKKGYLLDGFNIKVTHPEGDSTTIFYGGFYIAEAPEYDAAQNLTSIIAYDELYPSMQAYTTSLWESGITVKNYLIAILNKLDINYDTNSLSLMANADNVITSEKYLDIENDSTEAAYTYRDILDEIARASGVTFAFKSSVGGNNPYKLYAIKPTESGYVIDESNLSSVTIGAKYGPVKGVVLSREPQEDNVQYPSTLSSSQTAVKISNVEIMEDESNDAYRETFIRGIYSNVLNTEYYLYALESFGIGFLNFGDIFTIKAADRENGVVGTEKSYKTIFMRTDMTIGSGVKEKSKLEAPQVTSTDYAAASTTDKALKKTMLKVDKQNQRITSLVKESAEKYSEFTQTAEGLEGKIADTEKNLKAEISATAESFKTTYAKTETVNGQIKGVTDQITSLSSQLDGLDNTIADKVSTEITKETTIKILAGQVESSISGNYVTKASYEDDKDDWVLKTDYNTKLNQTDQSISAAVKRVSTLEEAGYITESQCSSLINAQADKITLAVESNLKIGVRNILLDSECFKSFTPSVQGIDGNLTIDHGTGCQTPSGEYKKIVWKKSGDYGGPLFTPKQIIGEEEKNITKIKKDTQYTLSFYAKATTGTTGFSLRKSSSFPIFLSSGTITYDDNRSDYVKDSGGNIAISPDEWRKVVLVFKITSDFSSFSLWFSPTTTSQVSLEISSLKVEEGNIATDWSPSVEDTEKSVQAKIDMCVQKDENNKLTSAIAIEGNKISIKSDKFELTNDGEVTCKRVAKDSETGTETITKFKMTNATLTHIYQDKQIGKIGISMDSSGLFYETITAGDMCGVMLKANSGNGYQIAIDNSTFNVVKNKSSANITLSEEGLGFTHKSAAAGVAVSSDWSSGNIPENERLLVATTYGLIIMSDCGLYLCGNASTWLCDTVRLGNYYNPDISGSGENKPLYVNTKTGIIST